MARIAGNLASEGLTTATEDRGSRVGLDPIDRVFVMENHDQAYHIWRDTGLKRRILIHIDAHHDMWWIKEPSALSIANFICPALHEDIVKEIYWVVPDPAWETARSRKPVLRHIRKLAGSYPGGPREIRVGSDQISTVVLGKPLRICPLALLPQIDEPVLLDIDVDFLVIPLVSYGEGDTHGPLPWCWADDLIARLCASNIRTDLVTISYSIEGGYTPLKWKYLGDELALRLGRPNDCAPPIHGMSLIHEAALAAHRGDLCTAEAKLLEAREILPSSPAPSFHLSHLYVEMGRIGDARSCYQMALVLDPSYRTASSTAGLKYHSEGRLQAAEQEHRRMLALDPHDACAHFGLGRIAARQKRWEEAEGWLRRSLMLNGHLIDAYRSLGDVLVKQGRHDEAMMAYERSLQLALSGHKPLERPIARYGEEVCVTDPDHCRIHARRARLYELKGEVSEAINGYRISIAGGYDGVLLRSRLAHLFLRQRQWRRAAKEVWEAGRLIPAALRTVSHLILQRIQFGIKDGLQALLAPWGQR